MSIFSKIGKGLKKLTLKKVLPFVAGAAALAIPGVGPVVAGAIGKATSVATKVIGGAAATVGNIAKGAGDLAGIVGTSAEQIGGAIHEARQSTAADVLGARIAYEDAAAAVDRALHARTSALSFLQSPTGAVVIVGALILLVVLLRK